MIIYMVKKEERARWYGDTGLMLTKPVRLSSHRVN